jgi:hypothetical protein
VLRNVLMIAGGTALGLLFARAPAVVHSATGGSPFDSPFAQTINGSLTLPPGKTGTLYIVSGIRYGVLGRFVASCTRSGLARTSYADGHSLSGLLIIDGRGASRGANLAVLKRAFPGGVKASGIEHWVMSTGGKPESISFDVSVRVLSATTNIGYCEFSLSGKLVNQLH